MLRNRGDMRAVVRMLVGDSLVANDGSANNIVPDNVIPTVFKAEAYGRFISDAYQIVAQSVPWCERQQLLDVTSGTATYAVEVRTIDHVDFDGKPLEPATYSFLERHDAKWRTRSGQPRFFVLGDDSEWSGSTREFRLYPTPDATESDVVRVIGKSAVPPLDNDLEAPALPGWMCDAVVYEAAAIALESYSPIRNEPLAAVYREISTFYIIEGQRALSDRYPSQERVVGRANPVNPNVHRFDPHINATGRAGSGA